jgi:hypothetical protein
MTAVLPETVSAVPLRTSPPGQESLTRGRREEVLGRFLAFLLVLKVSGRHGLGQCLLEGKSYLLASFAFSARAPARCRGLDMAIGLGGRPMIAASVGGDGRQGTAADSMS